MYQHVITHIAVCSLGAPAALEVLGDVGVDVLPLSPLEGDVLDSNKIVIMGNQQTREDNLDAEGKCFIVYFHDPQGPY